MHGSPESGAQGFELSDVTGAFPSVTALKSISLRIEPGECVGIVGPSGSGKTSLLRILNGFTRASHGRVTVGGTVVSNLEPRALRSLRSRIGFIHQDLSLVPNLRVIRNVQLGRLGQQSFLASLRSIVHARPSEALEIHELLERVGIAEKLYERTDRLSGGQQQRVAIARALYQHPGALLADEPVASVDPTRARELVRLLTEISRERGLTLVTSLHNLDLAREFFPRLVGLRRGRIAFDAAGDTLGEEEFRSLYTLDEEEILEDGAPT